MNVKIDFSINIHYATVTVSHNPNWWPVVLFVYYFLPFCIQGEI